jgi:hypothetical protein
VLPYKALRVRCKRWKSEALTVKEAIGNLKEATMEYLLGALAGIAFWTAVAVGAVAAASSFLPSAELPHKFDIRSSSSFTARSFLSESSFCCAYEMLFAASVVGCKVVIQNCRVQSGGQRTDALMKMLTPGTDTRDTNV